MRLRGSVMNGMATGAGVLICFALTVPNGAARAWGQKELAATRSQASEGVTGAIPDRPFSATKYAMRVRVLPDGKLRFLGNERYPTKIARDAQGRIMMQTVDPEELSPECDELRLLSPPPCPSWTVFVIDPVAHTVAHWTEGERAAHIVVDMPISDSNLEQAIRSTSNLPAPLAGFSTDEGDVKTVDFGSRVIDGVVAHGVRTILENRASHRLTRIHEVWIAAEMNLIVRVVDGDPNGTETVWGLKKVSLHPDPALFSAPEGYERQHQVSDVWAMHDFEHLQTWFEK